MSERDLRADVFSILARAENSNATKSHGYAQALALVRCGDALERIAAAMEREDDEAFDDLGRALGVLPPAVPPLDLLNETRHLPGEECRCCDWIRDDLAAARRTP